jgi:preprotein translocase subunit SecY
MEDDPREGQKWMEKWTYILAIPMAALQAIGQINIFNGFDAGTKSLISPDFRLAITQFIVQYDYGFV